MSIFDDARRRAAEQQGAGTRLAGQARRALNSPRINQGSTSSMRLPNLQQQGGSATRGPRGFRQVGEEAQSLMETRGQKIREAAKKKSALQRAGAEKGLAAQVGRSARQGGSGGRGEVLGQVGSDLSREAAATAASAELAATDADLEAKKFEGERYVSPADARNSVEAYIDSVEENYAKAFGDDEAGLADDLDRWADEKGADGRPLHSANEISYARNQARRLRAYDKNFWTHTGGRHIGSI